MYVLVHHVPRSVTVGERLKTFLRYLQCPGDPATNAVSLLKVDVLEQIPTHAARGNGVPVHIGSAQLRDRALNWHQPLAKVLVNPEISLYGK